MVFAICMMVAFPLSAFLLYQVVLEDSFLNQLLNRLCNSKRHKKKEKEREEKEYQRLKELRMKEVIYVDDEIYEQIKQDTKEGEKQ